MRTQTAKFVADSVNRGISTARRMHAACMIGLSINKDLKLKKRKGRDRQQRKKLYTITRSRKGHMSSASTITAFSASAIILPPLQKSLPSGFIYPYYNCGCSYLYTLLVAYYLYYASILSIYLSTLVV